MTDSEKGISMFVVLVLFVAAMIFCVGGLVGDESGVNRGRREVCEAHCGTYFQILDDAPFCLCLSPATQIELEPKLTPPARYGSECRY